MLQEAVVIHKNKMTKRFFRMADSIFRTAMKSRPDILVISEKIECTVRYIYDNAIAYEHKEVIALGSINNC